MHTSNETSILGNIASFSKYYRMFIEEPTKIFKKRMPHVFCDIDGVLADFYMGLKQHFKVEGANAVEKFLSSSAGWDIIAKEEPHFFLKLPMLPGAHTLMSTLVKLRDSNHIRLSILTAISNEWYADPVMRRICTQDKTQWITSRWQIPPANVLVVRRKDKQKYARVQQAIGHPSAMLIDDFYKNVLEWEMAGGHAIHHISATRTIQRLMDYLN